MVKLNFETDISIDIYPKDKIAIMKIQDIEIARIQFDTFNYDNHSAVFFISDRDVCNVDYDLLRVW